MPGVDFPPASASDRETSHEYASPANLNLDDIPIDPALGGLVSEEPVALVQHGVNKEQPQVSHEESEMQPLDQDHYIRQYSQGPQGDPFAPQPLPVLFPEPQPEPIPTPKPSKRKRKQNREGLCGVCHGDESQNGQGVPEHILTCEDCGQTRHPSCVNLKDSEPLRSHPWRCADCRFCETCSRKDDDSNLLLCDSCDRGWHLTCLDPPMDETPDGDWYCSECPAPEPEYGYQTNVDSYYDPPGQISDYPPGQSSYPSATSPSLRTRASSIASSSRSVANPSRGQAKGTARLAAIFSDESEMEADVETTTRTPVRRARGRPPGQSSKKGKGRAVREDSEEDDLPSSVRQTKRTRMRQSPVNPPPAIPRVRLRLPQKGKGKEREEEESKGMFDDVLEERDRDTSKTTIALADKQRFERSRTLAEVKLVPPPPPLLSEPPDPGPVAGPSSRPLRSAAIQHVPLPTKSTSPAPSTPGGPSPNTDDPPSLRIRSIRFGPYEIKTWYDAPFPEEYANIPDGCLWICEFCLKYMKSKFGAVRHRTKCKARHPPGDEIYRDGSVSIFEVDGRKNKIYCQNLCLLSKMYLDHKSLFYDVEPFLFYVITEVDDMGARFVGYFSKEKRSPKDYNVSCIMTLPVRQRQGWGSLLIDFSYLLSKKERRTGSPEKPLSGLGALGYKNYWTLSLMRYLETAPEHPRLEDVSAATSMTIEDIYTTLVQQNMIRARPATPPPVKPSPGQSIKYIKGRKTGAARRHLQRTASNITERNQTQSHSGEDIQANGHIAKGPFVAPKEYEIRWDPEAVHTFMKNWEAKGYLRLKPEKLKWSPFVLVRAGADGEVGVVKKTEAREAVGTEKLAARDESGTSNGVGQGKEKTTGRGSDTPFSLFDDDNVVSAAELELPDLSAITKPDSPSRMKAKVPISTPKSGAEEVEQTLQMEKDPLLAEESSAKSGSGASRLLRTRSRASATPTPLRKVTTIEQELSPPRTKRIVPIMEPPTPRSTDHDDEHLQKPMTAHAGLEHGSHGLFTPTPEPDGSSEALADSEAQSEFNAELFTPNGGLVHVPLLEQASEKTEVSQEDPDIGSLPRKAILKEGTKKGEKQWDVMEDVEGEVEKIYSVEEKTRTGEGVSAECGVQDQALAAPKPELEHPEKKSLVDLVDEAVVDIAQVTPVPSPSHAPKRARGRPRKIALPNDSALQSSPKEQREKEKQKQNEEALALAAKPRQLRNRAVVASGDTGVGVGSPVTPGQHLKRNGSTGKRLGRPPKKRRVDGSPEVENQSEPYTEEQPGSLTTPVNGIHAEEQTPTRDTTEPLGVDETAAALLSLSNSNPAFVYLPNNIANHALVMPMIPKASVHSAVTHAQEDGEVKLEDFGPETPSTWNVTSRHSHPSDVTVSVADTNAEMDMMGLAGKGDEMKMVVDISVRTENGDEDGDADADGEADVDEDADGEYDIDEEQ